MIYDINITKPAELDISAAVSYIANDLQNPIAANNLLDEIELAITSLENMPNRQTLVKNENLASLGFRILQVKNYLIFYIIREETKSVTIERFLHCRRDWNSILDII